MKGSYQLKEITTAKELDHYNIPQLVAQSLVHKGGVDVETYRQDLINRLDAKSYSFKVLALVNEDNQAVAVATGWDEPTKDGLRFHLQSLAVDTTQRGKGLSEQILNKINTEYLKDKGYNALDIEVSTKSLEKNATYYMQKLGTTPSKVMFSVPVGKTLEKPNFTTQEEQKNAVDGIVGALSDRQIAKL